MFIRPHCVDWKDEARDFPFASTCTSTVHVLCTVLLNGENHVQVIVEAQIASYVAQWCCYEDIARVTTSTNALVKNN